jgi:protein TonB
VKSWAASLALHGAVIGALAWSWLDSPPEKPAVVLRWDVALVAREPEPVTRLTPPEPARARLETPKPAPESVSKLQAVPKPMPTDPEPAVIETHEAPVRAVAEPVPEPAPEKRTKPMPQVDEAARAAAIERRWYQVLMGKLRAMKHYPMVARRLGQEGVVLVEARFASDGGLTGLALKRASGFPVLDNDALKLVESAAEAARSELRPGRPAHLEIPIAYKLNG